ncbi:MAG: hypothetical protein NZV14_18110 [Bryobacteraceae bacterium]|nr:hypothetical protein [Bryobacteraceae bacterium]MDW8380080.1 hypothetical protein [Bryobacterales bacterium]
MKVAVVLLCWGATSFAQGPLRVFTVNGVTETPVAGIVQLGSTSTGDVLQVQFRIRNGGATAQTLQLLSISGAGFRLHQAPTLPFPIAPNFSVDFYVQFQSSEPVADARGALRLNELTVTLVAEARAAPVVSVVQEDGSLSRRMAGQAVVFPPTERDGSSARWIVLENPHRAPLMVNLGVSGESFRLAAPPPQPLILERDASRSFELRFEPASAGLKRGALLVDQRTFPLEGVATEPAPPRPSIAIPTGGLESSKQVPIAVLFEEASRAEAKGQLRFEFTPSMAGPDDPAIVFLPVNRRSIEFQVRPGDRAAQFGSQREVILQTGTTAGTLRIVAEMSGWRTEAQASIPPAPAVLDKLTAFKTTATLDLTVSGYDNTRSISEIAFTFYDAQGTMIPPGNIRSFVAPLFQDYFRTTSVGGMFSLRAIFPSTAPTQGVRYVEMEVTNQAGTSKTQRIEF